MAILEAVCTWRPYLLGKKFFIQTNQGNFKYLIEQRIITPEQQKWVAKLLDYDYEIIYQSCRENSVVDALSRVQGSPILHRLIVPHVHLW